MPIASSATPVEPARAVRSVLSAVRSRITWLRAAEAALLIITLGLRVWGLDQNGFGIEYYSAAVRSMTQSWHNFLYNSFDPAGFLSVDKPRAASPPGPSARSDEPRRLGWAALILPEVLDFGRWGPRSWRASGGRRHKRPPGQCRTWSSDGRGTRSSPRPRERDPRLTENHRSGPPQCDRVG